MSDTISDNVNININDIEITEEDIKSHKINLSKYVPPYTKNDKVFQMLYSGQEREMAKLRFYIDDMLKQKNIYTATWGLDYWEQDYGIPTNHDDDYETRRARVIAKMRGKGTTTPRMLERVCMSFLNVDDSATCEPHNEEYYYWLYLNSEHGFPKKSMEDLYNAIWEVNPCHLEPRYRFRSITKTDLRVVSYHAIGETIRVYPYMVDNISSNANVYIGSSGYKTYETITNYPSANDEIVFVQDENKNNIVDDKNNNVIE